MDNTDRRAGVFYDRLTNWQDEARMFREILLATPLVETFKWRQPCYGWEGENVALVGVFRDFCALSIFRGVLLNDPEGILVPPGENSRSARIFRATSTEDISAHRDALHACLLEAIELHRAGRTVAPMDGDPDHPEELTEALDADPGLAEAFAALTPGRRRGWILQFAGAKQAATRRSRIEKAMPRILEGQGPHDR
ncbi:hypothetical protein ATO6_21610 [Oceanicola sp. 22II-s10i]|uniref:YdeI/OmpD-associated family protein n=1 Tax=Oceanicola sp. 22II-s10i TaxID=1317116 RepID=UPI000B520472|nr:YdeI/OmpD-associated family protein [Oceanicola sp. 22II-s10i]OWU82901.1 hypothetical protein ATO6_21610 [Oceanicola sp. 22II-s10i]